VCPFNTTHSSNNSPDMRSFNQVAVGRAAAGVAFAVIAFILLFFLADWVFADLTMDLIFGALGAVTAAAWWWIVGRSRTRHWAY
jgi:hypothetical protein